MLCITFCKNRKNKDIPTIVGAVIFSEDAYA